MTTPTTFEEFADAVSATFPSLSPQQQLIAQHVLEHPHDFALGTAATVAEAAGVQPSALVRFANAMNFTGFSELQQLFRHRLLQQSGTYRQRISAMRPAAVVRPGEAPLLQQFAELGVSDLHQLERSVPDAAVKQVRELATTYDVDEVMVHPVAGAASGTPADRSPAREDTLRLLAEALA